MRSRHIGQFDHRIPNVAEAYFDLAAGDESAGHTLFEAGQYRHAVYFFIQAMEKYVRHKIYTKVNANLKFYRDATRTHNLDELLVFLVTIFSGNERIRHQIQRQLDDHVLQGIRFGHLHNNLRYVMYSDRHSSFSLLQISKADAQFAIEKLDLLKGFMDRIDEISAI